MSQRWIDSQSDEHASRRAADFWDALGEDVDAGAFWAERIKQYRDEPSERLRIAMDNLPLPAAFREAAIATRALIRLRRKVGEDYQEELGFLYWLAAIESFMLPYADYLKEPGFNVIESIPGARLRSLRIDYRALGYEQLGLLGKTDMKWLVESWGEPERHTTLNEIHRPLWDEYEQKLIEQRRVEREAWGRELHKLDKPARASERTRRRAGCLGMIAVMGTAAVALSYGRAFPGRPAQPSDEPRGELAGAAGAAAAETPPAAAEGEGEA